MVLWCLKGYVNLEDGGMHTYQSNTTEAQALAQRKYSKTAKAMEKRKAYQRARYAMDKKQFGVNPYKEGGQDVPPY